MTDTTTASRPHTLTEHERLKALLVKRHSTAAASWATESIQMAQDAVAQYDGRELGDFVNDRIRYHKFFRETVPVLYAGCHDVLSASLILAVLIAEQGLDNG